MEKLILRQILISYEEHKNNNDILILGGYEAVITDFLESDRFILSYNFKK